MQHTNGTCVSSSKPLVRAPCRNVVRCGDNGFCSEPGALRQAYAPGQGKTAGCLRLAVLLRHDLNVATMPQSTRAGRTVGPEGIEGCDVVLALPPTHSATDLCVRSPWIHREERIWTVPFSKTQTSALSICPRSRQRAYGVGMAASRHATTHCKHTSRARRVPCRTPGRTEQPSARCRHPPAAGQASTPSNHRVSW